MSNLQSRQLILTSVLREGRCAGSGRQGGQLRSSANCLSKRPYGRELKKTIEYFCNEIVILTFIPLPTEINPAFSF